MHGLRHATLTGLQGGPDAGNAHRELDIRRPGPRGNPFRVGDGRGREADRWRSAVCDAYDACLAAALDGRDTTLTAIAERFGLPAGSVVPSYAAQPWADYAQSLREEFADLQRRLRAGEAIGLACACFPRRCHAGAFVAAYIDREEDYDAQDEAHPPPSSAEVAGAADGADDDAAGEAERGSVASGEPTLPCLGCGFEAPLRERCPNCDYDIDGNDDARSDAASERFGTCPRCDYDRVPYWADGCPRCDPDDPPVAAADGTCDRCDRPGQHGEQCRECAGPVCRPGERPNGVCGGCGAIGWECQSCYSCGGGFEGPNFELYFGEWLPPEEVRRRRDDEHSEQDTEDEEERHPEMAYINHTQNDDEPNMSPPAVSDAGADTLPHDDAPQQSAGALTMPPQVATGLPAADTSSSSSRGRPHSRVRRREESGRSRSRAHGEAASGSSDDDGGQG